MKIAIFLIISVFVNFIIFKVVIPIIFLLLKNEFIFNNFGYFLELFIIPIIFIIFNHINSRFKSKYHKNIKNK